MIKLIAFDLSGTLSPSSINSLLAEGNDKKEEADAIVQAYHRGDIASEDELFGKLKEVWKGLDVSKLAGIYERMDWFEGVKETLAELRSRDIKLVLISSVPTVFLDVVAANLDFDAVYGTGLKVENGKLTNEINTPNVPKEESLRQACLRFGLSCDEVMAVGDSRIDAGMLRRAGIGVAFRGKPEAKAAADYCIEDFKQIIEIAAIGRCKQTASGAERNPVPLLRRTK